MNDSIESLELKIAKFLRLGVLLAGALMLIGWVGMLLNGGNAPTLTSNPFLAFSNYQEVPLATQWSRVLATHSVAGIFCYAGLGLLISLPLIRVLLTALLFIKQREWVLGGIAVVVLMGLILSFMVGGLEGA